MQIEPSEEVVAKCIMARFPHAHLKVSVADGSKVFQISLSGTTVLDIDHLGAEFHFPTKGSNVMKWTNILEGGPEQVAENILRKMADAGYTVLSKQGRPIRKSQIRLGAFTCCPQCNEPGKVKRILYGMPAQDYNHEKYVLGGCCVTDDDPEIQCTACDWSGMMEEVRFTKRNTL